MKNPFFTKDGRIELPKEHVTWFAFFTLSRALRSPNGGWNFKRYWWDRGLKPLASNDGNFIAAWTANSLEAKAEPKPRKKSFCFLREDSTERGALAKCQLPLGSTSENVINYRIWKSDQLAQIFNLDCGMNLLGYEVPLCEERQMQLKVDLFGISTHGSETSLEIIELKRANSSDSPLLALVEGICYAIQALRCAEALAKESPELSQLGVASSRPKKLVLTLAAPAPYWEKWSEKRSQDEFEPAMKQIIDHLNEAPAFRERCQMSLRFRTLPEDLLGPDRNC